MWIMIGVLVGLGIGIYLGEKLAEGLTEYYRERAKYWENQFYDFAKEVEKIEKDSYRK